MSSSQPPLSPAAASPAEASLGHAAALPGPWDLDAYLARIGYAGPRLANLDLLQSLHHRHALAIPFENLDSLLGREVSLAPMDLQDKLLRRGRGGYCFEHNLLFLAALRALGFQAEGLAARVLWNAPPDNPPPRTHMLLRVQLPEGDWLADLGFGGMTQSGALHLDTAAAQTTPHERYRLRPDSAGRRILEAEVAGDWRSLYAFDLQPQEYADYVMANWYISRHPDSRFTRELIVTRPGEGCRQVLHGRRYTLYHLDGGREERELPDVAALCALLEEGFGLNLEGLELDRLSALFA